jgi:hypothetical protein
MTEFTFKDKAYDTETVSERAKYFITQINYIQDELYKERCKIDRLELSNKAFNELLEVELGEEEKEEGA